MLVMLEESWTTYDVTFEYSCSVTMSVTVVGGSCTGEARGS